MHPVEPSDRRQEDIICTCEYVVVEHTYIYLSIYIKKCVKDIGILIDDSYKPWLGITLCI